MKPPGIDRNILLVFFVKSVRRTPNSERAVEVLWDGVA